MNSWAHPEGKRGTHTDYARRGARAQPSAAKARKTGNAEQDRKQRIQAEEAELRRLGIL